MPIHKTSAGYKYGTTDKTYPTKEQAERQMRAIKASESRQKSSSTSKKK